MLRGDVSKLAEKLNCSKTTIYNLSEKIGIDLHPIHGRCDKTVDILSGKTLQQEQEEWIYATVNLIERYKKERKIAKELKIAEKNKGKE